MYLQVILLHLYIDNSIGLNKMMIMIENRTTVLEVFQFIVYFMYIIYHQIYTCVSKTKYNKYVTEYNRVFIRYTCIFYLSSGKVYK